MSTKTNWTTKGTQINKDGKATFFKGVCYSPTPCGAATFAPGIGDWFTEPWDGIWKRDFPLMKAAGINNIRTYFFWAWEPPADMKNWEKVIATKPTFNHTAFLDAALESGISVTIGIALDGGNVFDNGDAALGEDYFNFYKATMAKLAELYGDHPAVMGFCLGNEQNTPARIINAKFWDDLEAMAKAVKAKAPNKLVMFAMQNDNPNMFTAQITGTSTSVPQRFAQIFDAWGLNIYAGMGITLANYEKYVVQGTDSALPAIISEWGIPGGKNVPDGAAGPPDGDATARELTTAEFATNITNVMDPDGASIKANTAFVAGAQFFEWTDEWWKNGATPIYEHTASASPDWPEEWWGLNAIAPNDHKAKDGPINPKTKAPYAADILTARPTLTALTKIYSEIKID